MRRGRRATSPETSPPPVRTPGPGTRGRRPGRAGRRGAVRITGTVAPPRTLGRRRSTYEGRGKECTVIATAHRPHTAHDVDRAAVTEDDKVTGPGAHGEPVSFSGVWPVPGRLWPVRTARPPPASRGSTGTGASGGR